MLPPFRSLLARLALGLIVWAVPPAQAQSSNATTGSNAAPLSQKPAGWTQQFEQQMVRLLRAPDAERPERAMQLIIHYAQMKDAEGDAMFDFSGAVSPLLRTFKHSNDEGRRLLALATLNAIGNEPAMREIARTIRHERSDVVRHRTLHVLSARWTRQ